METKLIRINEDILVEVNSNSDMPDQISSKLAEKVDSSLEKLKEIFKNISDSVSNSWSMMEGANKIEQAEIELGISFEAEGNLYIAKSKASANLNIKLIIKPNR